MKPQEIVAEAVRERGYRDGWTPAEFLARQLMKLQEELAEAAALVNIKGQDGGWRYDAAHAGMRARLAFDRAQPLSVAVADPTKLRTELADIQVVLFNAAEALSFLLEDFFDIEDAAIEKATSDITRGVR